uniref:cDNA FLJ54179 n=1 Tax=Homo sapiens TaxID=9606 RepID=B4DVL1_HUMAN|nr:unnamed protein product [Homo sapiens]
MCWTRTATCPVWRSGQRPTSGRTMRGSGFGGRRHPYGKDSPAPPGSAELPGLQGSVPPHWGGVAGNSAGHRGPRARCPRGGAGGCAHHHPGPPQLLRDSRPCRTGWQESAGAEARGQGREVFFPPARRAAGTRHPGCVCAVGAAGAAAEGPAAPGGGGG